MPVETNAHGQRNAQSAGVGHFSGDQLLCLDHRLAINRDRIRRVFLDMTTRTIARKNQIERWTNRIARPATSESRLPTPPTLIRQAISGSSSQPLSAQLPAQSSTLAK